MDPVAEREAKRTALILATSQAIVGSAAPISISIGALAGHYLLDADKSLATAPVTGFNVGVALGADHPEVPGLVWVTPDAVSQYWDTAAVVITTVAAVATFPADLTARAGVFVLVRDETPDAVWNAVVALDMQALVTYWPACQPWLLEQLRAPSSEFNEFRSR